MGLVKPHIVRVDGPTGPDVRVESLAWGTSATVSRPLQMSCRGRQWMCRWTTTTVPDVEGVLEQAGVDVAYATDIPAMPRSQVTEYRVQVCRCRGCGRRVRGCHAEVGSDQYVASAHRVGRRVMAAAHMLHYGVGIPVRRVPTVLRALTGVELSQSAITQDALRRVQGSVGDAYRRLRESVRESAVVHTDDTGWRVDGESAFLMVFETEDATVYQVRGRHRNEEVREVVPGRSDGDGQGTELRCSGSVGSETAEVSGACAALDQ